MDYKLSSALYEGITGIKTFINVLIESGLGPSLSGIDKTLDLSKIDLNSYYVLLEKHNVVVGALITDDDSEQLRSDLKHVLERFVSKYSGYLYHNVIDKAIFREYGKVVVSVFGGAVRNTIIDDIYEKLVFATKKQKISIMVFNYRTKENLESKNIVNRRIKSILTSLSEIRNNEFDVKKIKYHNVIIFKQRKIGIAITGKEAKTHEEIIKKTLWESKESINALNYYTDKGIDSYARKKPKLRRVRPPIRTRPSEREEPPVRIRQPERVEPPIVKRRTLVSILLKPFSLIPTKILAAVFLLVIIGIGSLGMVYMFNNYFRDVVFPVIEEHDYSWELESGMEAHLDFSAREEQKEPTRPPDNTTIPIPSYKVNRLTANWATQIPQIDNVVQENEWIEAAVITLTPPSDFIHLSNITLHVLNDQLKFYFRLDFFTSPLVNNDSVITKELSIHFVDYNINETVGFDLNVKKDDLEWSEVGYISKADFSTLGINNNIKILTSKPISQLDQILNDKYESKVITTESSANATANSGYTWKFEIINPRNGSTVKGIALIEAQLSGNNLTRWKITDVTLVVDYFEISVNIINETHVKSANATVDPQDKQDDKLVINFFWDSNFIKPGARVISIRAKISNEDNSSYVILNSYPILVIKSRVKMMTRLKGVIINSPTVGEFEFLFFPIVMVIMIFFQLVMINSWKKRMNKQYLFEKGDEN
ncbi:MAG: hypothetical protein ACXAEU_21985 [Candidatus Hodarchaeales archaeon]